MKQGVFVLGRKMKKVEYEPENGVIAGGDLVELEGSSESNLGDVEREHFKENSPDTPNCMGMKKGRRGARHRPPCWSSFASCTLLAPVLIGIEIARQRAE